MKTIWTYVLLLAIACSQPTGGGSSAAITIDGNVVAAITGQSNATGGAKLVDITDPTVEAEMGVPYESVTLMARVGASKTDPIPWTDYPPDALAPQPDYHQHFGIELTLGRRMEELFGPSALAKFSGNGMGLHEHRRPAANYPTLPAGTPNFYSQFATYSQDAEATLTGTVGILVEMGGERDSKLYGLAINYAENQATHRTQYETDLGHAVIHVFVRLNDAQGGEYNTVVRAEQETYAASADCTAMVDSDDLELRDTEHYTADAYLELGDRIAEAAYDVSLQPGCELEIIPCGN